MKNRSKKNLVRPFTLNRLADLVHLASVNCSITAADVEQAMLVTRDRAKELIKQAEEMKLIKKKGYQYRSTSLGTDFFESFKSGDHNKLDITLSQYPPYHRIKQILSTKSADMSELKNTCGLTEVAVEIIIRLLKYVRDDLDSINEKYFFRKQDLPEFKVFFEILKKVYHDMTGFPQWGCPKDYIRVDKIATNVCNELRISVHQFSELLDEAIDTSVIEVHSEISSFQFLPFMPQKINPKSYQKCYLKLR